MNIKNFMLIQIKKVLSQKTKDGKTITDMALKMLVGKTLDYITRGENKTVLKLIMDRFVPRNLRKIVQELFGIEDRVKELLFDFAEKMNDDGFKEDSFILLLSALKKVILSIDQMIDETIEKVKLPSHLDKETLLTKIEHTIIKLVSENEKLEDIPLADNLIKEGFEKL